VSERAITGGNVLTDFISWFLGLFNTIINLISSIFGGDSADVEDERKENFRQRDAVKAIIAKSDYAATDTAWNKGAAGSTERLNNRKRLLGLLLGELQGVMGTSAVTTIGWISNSDYPQDSNGNSTAPGGFYTHTGGNAIGNSGRISAAKTLYINTDEFDNYPFILRAVAHELRHCYQREASAAFSTKHIVSSTTRGKWSANFSKYVEYVDTEAGKKAYYTQPVEWDAYFFSNDVSRIERYKGDEQYWLNWYAKQSDIVY